MAAKKFDFVKSSCGGSPCEQGASFYYELVWEKEDPPGSGTFIPVDLTGYTAKMQVRKESGTALIVELSTANSRIIIDPLLGKITLSISATDTNNLAAGMYKYDLELTSSTGFVIRFIQGQFEVIGQITV